jgi:FMN phosphatase YigB (HAD superfamily)
VRGILFDLDGTLLDIEMGTFLVRYFNALGPVVAEVIGAGDAQDALDAVMGATRAMMLPHPGLTNEEAFRRMFTILTGTDIGAASDKLEEFYTSVFPTLQDGMGPRDGAREAVETAIELGLRVAVATNPIFPALAVRERIRWAGMSDVAFDAVTTYEHMHSCKPSAEYFLDTADLLGLSATECIMVGDDVDLDMPAGAVGMSTFYVGTSRGKHGDSRGSLRELAMLLRNLE